MKQNFRKKGKINRKWENVFEINKFVFIFVVFFLLERKILRAKDILLDLWIEILDCCSLQAVQYFSGRHSK